MSYGRKVVLTRSRANSNSLMPSLGNRGNNSVLLGYVESTNGKTGQARDVIKHQFRTFIEDG